MGQLDEAIAVSERHIKEIPSDTKGYANKGVALEQQNKWEEALKVYEVLDTWSAE